MRQHPPETLVLRIRAETLRLNLKRAHAAFKDLPSLMGQFKDIADCLSGMHQCAADLYDKVVDLRRVVVRGEMPRKDDVKEVQDRFESVAEGLASAKQKLDQLGAKSFLVQMRAEGQTTWESLNKRAVGLQGDIDEIEKNLSGPNAWKALAKAEREANEHVFHESIELLGGIALRDAHLDADICALAEALIRSILGSKAYPNVIPGGVSSMMMRIERFIRLRFPEWTIWGLPLAAHELWRVSARAQYDNLLARPFGPEGSKVIEDPTIQQCLGDAFATYFMGPAYTRAAVTLLFDPERAQDDLRVRATESMLRLMDPTKPNAFSESYQTVADNLVSAWKAAKHQAGMAMDLSKAENVEKAVAALFRQLTQFSYPCFSVAEWKSSRDWAEKLQNDAGVDAIDISERHDLRHALNAVWHARLDAARTEDISERAHRLAHRVKVEMDKRPPGGPGGQLRGLR